ncbi:hypothetical protein [Lacinutrix chionoecetis]
MKKVIKIIFLALFTVAQLSCNNNDKGENALVGEWLRSDVNDSFKYKLTFNTNNEVLKTTWVKLEKDQELSSATSYNWEISADSLTIFKFEEHQDVITEYHFTSDGNLILSDLTDLEFIKQ